MKGGWENMGYWQVFFWDRWDLSVAGQGYRINIRQYMSELFHVVANQFQSNTQYDKFIKESQREYDVKIYYLSNFTQMHAKHIYAELQAKYQDKTLTVFPHGWYQNQRRLYVWFIICFIHYKAIDPVKFLDGYDKYWRSIGDTFWHKEQYFLKYQLLNIFKIKGRTIWKNEEDNLLRKAFKMHQFGEWNEVAKTFYQQSKGQFFKTPKQCRERWQNHLNDDVKKGDWSWQQDLVIFEEVNENGTKWARIAVKLQRKRTEHMIKNRYKSLISKIINERNVSEKQATLIKLRELKQKQEQGRTDRRTRGSLNDELGIQQVESQEVEESEVIEEETTKKNHKGKSKKIKKEERQSINKSKGWSIKRHFDINKSLKQSNEGNIGDINNQSQMGSFFGRNLLLDQSISKFNQILKIDMANPSLIFGFSRGSGASNSFKSVKDERKKEDERASSIFYQSGRSKNSNRSIKNGSIIGQYLFDN